jgi:hypothetical protein
MRVYDEIAEAKQAAMEFAESLAQRVIVFTRASMTSADGEQDGAEGWPTDGDGDQAQLPVRRMEPWGHHGRHPSGVLQVLARAMAGAAQNLGLGIWTQSHGRQDLAEGATQLYCIATNAEVYLDENGQVLIRAAANQNATMQATGTGVAQVTADAVTGVVKLGPVGNLPVLVQGSFDGMGMPVTQAPIAVATIVMAG